MASLAYLRQDRVGMEVRRLMQETAAVQGVVDIEAIITAVAKALRVTVEQIKSRRKTQHVAFARQVAMYLAREMTDLSFPEIGAAFGRDHSTVIHAHNLIAARAKGDAHFRSSLRKLTGSIGAGK